jgi:hypothetical protein
VTALAAGLAIGVWTWIVASTFMPMVRPDAPVEYVFVGAPLWLLPLTAVAAAVLLTGIARRVGSSSFARPLLLLAVAPLSAVALIARAIPHASVVLYALVDLRPWWTAAILVAAVRRAGMNVPRVSISTRTAAVALFVILAGWGIATTPHLRFDAALHGDEPKYLRFCENWYQGRGLEVGNVQTMADLGARFSPPLARNISLLADALRQDGSQAAADLHTLVTQGFATRFNRAEYAQAWIVRGRNGGYYQVHNPGLSALLFPAYFIDRHFIATGAGHQGVFPDRLPVTNAAVLAIWAAWGVALFALLRVVTGNELAAWCIAALAMMTMPMAAFGFQIYPEAAAGIMICAVLAWGLGRAATADRFVPAFLAGAAAGFLPWLHVRFLVLSVVVVMWVALRARRRTGLVVAYSIFMATLCVYAYHITGSVRPDAMYAAEGAESAWIPAEARQSVVSLPLDRIWGFFPHAPVYLLAVAGWLLLARRSRPLAIALPIVIAALAVPVAGHGFTAAGATPLRQLAAVIPLLAIPLWALVSSWRHVQWIRVTAALLTVLSLDTAVSYNLHHYKEVGRHVDEGFSGWAPNLLFPWTHGALWTDHRGTFVLFTLWALTLVALFIAGRMYRAASFAPSRSRAVPVTVMVAAVILFSAATALGGEWTRVDYFVPPRDAHNALIRAAAAQDRCRLCFSSTRGRLGRATIVEAGEQHVAAKVLDADATDAANVRIYIWTWTDAGIGWGSVAIDFGDGSTAHHDIAGDDSVRHRYPRPGTYRITIRFNPATGPPKQESLNLTIS